MGSCRSADRCCVSRSARRSSAGSRPARSPDAGDRSDGLAALGVLGSRAMRMRDVVGLLGFALGVGCQSPAAPTAGSAIGSGPATASAMGSAGSDKVSGSSDKVSGSSDKVSGGSDKASGGSSTVPAGASTAAEAPKPARVTLPKTGSEPPHRTARPLSLAELERLAAIEFKDFDRQDRGVTGRITEFRHSTKTRPILGVTVTIEPCDRSKPQPPRRAAARKNAANAAPRHICTPMELDRWKARTDELKQSLSKALIARPETRFEVGTRDVLGVPAIYTYQLGSYFGKDETGNPVGSYSDAYILYYNDGVNEIRVNAAYIDDAIGGMDKLLAVAPPEDLEKLAVAFMSFYLHEW